MVEYFTKPIFLTTIICLLVFYTGIKLPNPHPYKGLQKLEDAVEITGIIQNSPVKSSSGKTYYCNLEIQEVISKRGIKTSGTGSIVLYIPTDSAETFFPGKLYSSSKEKGSYLYETGGIYTFTGKYTENGFIVKECKSCHWAENLIGRISYFRALCRLQFKRLLFAWGESGGLLLALLCGAKEYTSTDVSAAFKNAGLSHILALSGMHLSMFSSIALFIGSKTGRKKMTFAIRCIALILFVWFAGFSPSLKRAFICAMLILFASVASVEQPDMLLILCFSFILQCTLSPEDITNAGFMLSYGALAGILVLNKSIFKLLTKFLPGYFASSLSASTGANVFTAPISIKLFGSFSPIGIIATTFVSPLITVFIYAGLALIVICLICPVFSNASGIFMNILYTIIKKLVLLFSKVPSISF